MEKQTFEKMEDPEVAKKLLKAAAGNLSEVVIWTKNQKLILECKLAGYLPETGVLRTGLPRSFDKTKAKEILRILTEEKEAFFCVITGKGNLFFSCFFESLSATQISFNSPEKFHKVQRRKHWRMKVYEPMVAILVDNKNPELRVEKRILDISAGGIAVLMPKHEVDNAYLIGEVIRNVKFQVRDRELCFDMVIRYKGEMPVTGRLRGVKLGLEFIDVDPQIEQWITAFIVEREGRRSLG